MAFMRRSGVIKTDIEILIAAEVRHKLDNLSDTSSIDRKLNLLIMAEIGEYKERHSRNALHLAENLDKAINDIVNIIAAKVPDLLTATERDQPKKILSNR